MNVISLSANETQLFIPGPVGQLEMMSTVAENNSDPIAIICHPHPLHGGTMNNKIVTTLVRTFRDLGWQTVRFNFRGVGKSEGVFDNGVGELEDLLAVIASVKALSPQSSLALAGFSFGAAMTIQAAQSVSLKQLVSIAPPVPRFDLLEVKHIESPWIVVQGDEDDVVIPEDVFQWVDAQEIKPILIRMEGAGHFFHGRLLELRQLLTSALESVRI